MKDVLAKKSPNSKDEVTKALLGAVVLTKYNNKSYKVDDIDWSMNPASTFVDDNGREKSFVHYYQERYNLVIQDKKQPMLVSRAKKKTKEEEDINKIIVLVPELCNLTGLTDQMKADFKVMKDVAQFTRITPTQRQEVIYLISQRPGTIYNGYWLFDFLLYYLGTQEVPEECQRLRRGLLNPAELEPQACPRERPAGRKAAQSREADVGQEDDIQRQLQGRLEQGDHQQPDVGSR